MTRQDMHHAHAEHDVRQAVTNILKRGGDPEHVALEIHQAYTGRGWKPPPNAPGQRCQKHPYSTPLVGTQCPICGPGD